VTLPQARAKDFRSRKQRRAAAVAVGISVGISVVVYIGVSVGLTFGVAVVWLGRRRWA
jgi:hypothetical protein